MPIDTKFSILTEQFFPGFKISEKVKKELRKIKILCGEEYLIKECQKIICLKNFELSKSNEYANNYFTEQLLNISKRLAV